MTSPKTNSRAYRAPNAAQSPSAPRTRRGIILSYFALSLLLTPALLSCSLVKDASPGPSSPSPCASPSSSSPSAPASSTALVGQPANSEKSQKTQFGIYAGDDTPSSVYPYIGGLFYASGGFEGLCTAALICPDVVLTAAHCFYESSSSASAPLSSYRFSLSQSVPFTGSLADASHLPPDSASAQRLQVHPSWQGSGAANSIDFDMAIVKLSHPFAVALAPLSFDAFSDTVSGSGVSATIVGYGEAVENSGTDHRINGAGYKRSGGVYYQGPYRAGVGQPGEPGTLIALRGPYGQDTCQGDSGGPLIINNRIYGTLSGGDSSGCGASVGSSDPNNGNLVHGVSFYTSVANNAAWIKSVMQDMCGTSTPVAIVPASGDTCPASK